jgi:peptidoglycan hydrolase-like protein with peptidoglycan-binding domain
MRIRGTRRSFAALGACLALTAVYGCKVEGTDGKGGNSPVHIDVPATSNTPDAPDAPDGKGTPESDAPSRDENRDENKPSAATVLWSEGDDGVRVRELQARLRQVAWLFDGPTGTYDDLTTKAVKGFQGKRGLPRTGETDSVTWARLLKMTRTPTKWELYAFGGQPAAQPDPRCMTGRALCISKTSRTLRWMVDGRTVSTMAVRFGAQYTPTREGVFSVYWKSRHHVSTLYDSPMPYAMFFSGGQAVHFSYDFAARGYAGGSHGCVNVRDEVKISQLFDQVRTGDKVVIYW